MAWVSQRESRLKPIAFLVSWLALHKIVLMIAQAKQQRVLVQTLNWIHFFTLSPANLLAARLSSWNK